MAPAPPHAVIARAVPIAPAEHRHDQHPRSARGAACSAAASTRCIRSSRSSTDGTEFAIMSYADRLSICAVADPGLVPDASELGAHLEAAAAELVDALGVHAAPVAAAATGSPSMRELMQTLVVTLVPGDTLATAWSLMRRYGIRHLPVVTPDGRLPGVVTHRDPSPRHRARLIPRGARGIALSASAWPTMRPTKRGAPRAGGVSRGRHAAAQDRLLRSSTRKAGRGIVTADDCALGGARMQPDATVRARLRSPRARAGDALRMLRLVFAS
jgi:CBS domain-containing protein